MARSLSFVLALGLTTVVAACGGGSSVSRDAVAAYASATEAAGKDGGRVVVEEIKPALTDLRLGHTTAEAFRTGAAGWRAELEAVRQRFLQAHPPADPRLQQAAGLFDEAMRGYEAALDAFVTAAATPAESLSAALAPGVALAEQADHTYDQARGLVDDARRRAGLSSTSALSARDGRFAGKNR